MKTIYKYLSEGQEILLFEDEEGVYKPEEIKAHYAQTFGGLLNSTYKAVEKDDVRTVTFEKKVGTKGAMHPLVTALLACPTGPLPGLALLARLDAGEPVAEEDLAAALHEAAALAYRTEEVLQRCLDLAPKASPRPPLGF